MAPEVLDSDLSAAYSVAVDIWAIGVITVELLLKRLPFLSPRDIFRYCDGQKQLDLNGVTGVDLSNTCQDFIRKLLTPNPITRLKAVSARIHPWVAAGLSPIQIEDS
jgi:serine/threonine protein kinase